GFEEVGLYVGEAGFGCYCGRDAPSDERDLFTVVFVGNRGCVEEHARSPSFRAGAPCYAARPKIARSFTCSGAPSGTGTGGAEGPVCCRRSAIGSVRSYTSAAISGSSASSAPMPRARSHEWISASVVISQQYSSRGVAPRERATVPASASGALKAAS